MTIRTQLYLDVGGVLGTNLDGFWHWLAGAAAIPHDQLRGRYKSELRNTLWTGELSEHGFWDWVCSLQSAKAPDEARALLLTHLQPMPAFASLPQLSRKYDIHILSNHRVEWLNPFLVPVRSHLNSITISAEVRCAKPDPAIYRIAAAHAPAGASILFVDDARHNLDAAASLGWSTLLADPDSRWLTKLLH
ncbi:HAD family hydrolase [Paenibacillus chartarius]|uniref:HAD family hydrolase n=1 Tax=Paenibacillus chartarius TaxID=747481 RepID=A0ABV6DFC7_9BACL